MRRQQIENAAFEVATQVRAVEDCIDATLTEIAELQCRMVRARSAMGIGPATGQGAFEQLAVTLQALITARGTMVQCHGELATAKQSIPGLRTTGFGDLSECPPPSGKAELRIVA